jgi:hypothetical protein
MKLPTQMRPTAASFAAVSNLSTATAGARPQGILPSDCCDGSVEIFSQSGQSLYKGTSGCCYQGTYCYPCGHENAKWQNYANQYFPQYCSPSAPCAVALTGCGRLTPYC